MGAHVGPFAVPSSATGIAFQLSNLPVSIRIGIDQRGQEYCAPLPGLGGSVNWGDFNTTCWNNQGTFLSGPPTNATFIHFSVTAVTNARAFDFCVTSLRFAGAKDGAIDDGAAAETGAPADGSAEGETINDGGDRNADGNGSGG